MKIENGTHWRSDQIMAIARRVAETELDPAKRKRFTVRVKYGRRGAHVGGNAYVGGRSINLLVGSDAIDTMDLAFTIAHEMAHARGMRHRQMRGSPRWYQIDGWRDIYAWAADMPVERQAPKAAPTLDDKRERRAAHCREMVAHWERRKKLASSKVRVWTRRLRSVEQRMALAAKRRSAT